MLKTVFRNMLANWLGYLVQFTITFLLTPLVVEHLGDYRYGLWVLLSSITGYYGLLDLGLRGGITQYMARYVGQKREEDVNKVLNSGLAMLSVVGLATLLLSLVVAWGAPWVLELTPELGSDVFWCVLIFGGATALQALAAPYTSLFAAAQRYDLSNVIGISTRILTALGCVAVLLTGHGLIALSLVVVAGNLADQAARVAVAYVIAPYLRLSWDLVDRATLRDVMGFGAWNFMIGVAHNVFEYADTIVIALVLGVGTITPYALASRIISNATSMLNSLRMVYFPAATQLHARGETAQLRTLYLTGSRLILSIGFLVFTLAWIWCDDFYRLWIDPELLSAETRRSTPVVFRILLVCLLAQQVSAIGVQMLLAFRHVKQLGLVVLAEALANLGLSLVWCFPWGLYGVAAATLVTTAVVRVLVLPTMAHHLLGLSATQFIRGAVLRPLVFGAAAMVAGVWIRGATPAESWMALALDGLAMLVVAGALGALFVITPDERSKVLDRLLPSRRRSVRAAADQPSGPVAARVLIVAPSLRIMGGQAVAADRLVREMRADGVQVDLQPINPRAPLGLRWAERIKYVRTAVVSTVYVGQLLRNVPRYDLIHIFSASYLSFIISQTPAILIARWYGKRIVLNYHSGQAEDHLRRWGHIVASILKLTDVIVVQTQYLVDVFARFGFHTVAIPNDVDTSAFPFQRRESFRPTILVARALEPLYNVGCAIRAFAIVQQLYPDANLTILGTGPQRAELERLATTLGLRNVRFTGRVERSDVPREYSEHDVFLNSSSVDNMPISILEAFAAGLPVVTTDAGGIPWMVEDRVTGHVVSVEDHQALADRMLEVLRQPEPTVAIVRRAYEELEKYQWSRIGPQWYALYNKLANCDAARASHASSPTPPGADDASPWPAPAGTEPSGVETATQLMRN